MRGRRGVASRSDTLPRTLVLPTETRANGTPVGRRALRDALRLAETLPVATHPGGLSCAGLHLLALVHELGEADRFELVARARTRESTVKKRLQQLQRAGLLLARKPEEPGKPRHRYRTSANGVRVVLAFAAGDGLDTLQADLEWVSRRTAGARERSISIAQIELLRLIAHEGERTVTSLLPRVAVTKPTLKSRLGYLERLELIRREERSNHGGGDRGLHATHYQPTPDGRLLLRRLMPA